MNFLTILCIIASLNQKSSGDKITEQRQIFQREYHKECSDFKQNDNIQWPISTQNIAGYAKKIFDLDWNIKAIIKEWQQNVNSTHTKILPDHYTYEIIQRSASIILIFFLVFVCSCLCCCQVFCIAEFKLFARCCNINIDADTRSDKEKYFLFFVLLFTAGAIIVVCGFSYIQIDKEIQSSSSQLRCTSLWMIITTLSSNEKFSWTANWQGVNAIDNYILKFAITLNNSLTQRALLQIAQINTTGIQIGYEERRESIFALYNQSVTQTLVNPDPLTFAQTPNISRPASQLGTITYSLIEELDERKDFIEILQSVANISSYLINHSQSLQQKFLNTKDQLDYFSLNLIKFLSKIEGKINDRKWIIDSAVQAFQDYLILVFLFCILCLASFCLVAWARIQKLAFLLHISWIALDIFLLIGLLIIAFVYYASVITDNVACNLSNQMIQDEQLFQQIVKLTRGNKYLTEQNSNQMIQLMRICLYNKGDLLSYFQLKEPVDSISKLNELIKVLQTNHTTKKIIQSQIKFVSDILQNYGQAVEQNQDMNSTGTPDNVLQTLNQWTNFNGLNSLQQNNGKCRVSQDEWEWNDNNCQYKSFYVANSEPDFEFGWTICFNFDETSLDFVQKRYSNPLFRECSLGIDQFGSVQNASIQYHRHLMNYIQSVKSVFKPMLSQMINYRQNLEDLDQDIFFNIRNVSNSAQQFDEIFQLIAVGIAQNGFSRIKNSLCVTLQEGLFFMYVYLISICSFLILNIIFAVWSAMRCIPNNSHGIFQDMVEEGKSNRQNRVQQY